MSTWISTGRGGPRVGMRISGNNVAGLAMLALALWLLMWLWILIVRSIAAIARWVQTDLAQRRAFRLAHPLPVRAEPSQWWTLGIIVGWMVGGGAFVAGVCRLAGL